MKAGPVKAYVELVLGWIILAGLLYYAIFRE